MKQYNSLYLEGYGHTETWGIIWENGIAINYNVCVYSFLYSLNLRIHSLIKTWKLKTSCITKKENKTEKQIPSHKNVHNLLKYKIKDTE